MKKSIALFLIVCLLLALFTACGAPTSNEGTASADAKPTPQESTKNDDTGDDEDAPAGLSTLEGFEDEYIDLLDGLTNLAGSDAILKEIKTNTMMACANLANVVLPATMYRMLNLYDEQGEFGSKTDEMGFMNKSGNKYTFGIEGKPLAEDNAGMGTKKGQRTIADGAYDGDAGLFEYKSTEDIDGAVIRKFEGFAKAKDGGMAVMYVRGGIAVDDRMDDYTHYMYVILHEGKYELVFAESTQGPEFSSIAFNPDWTIADAKSAFESSGAAVYCAGTIENDAFTAQ